MSVGDNRRYCECMGFYDGAGSCLPYDPEIHEAEPCPPNQFWGGIFDWFSNTTTDQWIGGTAFGIQMCKLFGGGGGYMAGGYGDPHSPAYMMYMQEQRRKTNTMIIMGIILIILVFWAIYKK